ncbi:hypothetical protein EMIT0P218_60314 [Pseudomonas sp. IT-P218]
MFGLGQTPVLAAGAEDGFQALIQALLVALQLSHQAAAFFQHIGIGQLFQARTQALLVQLQALRLIVQSLHLTQLLLGIGLQVPHLPDSPATHCDTDGAYQQRDDCQPVSSALLLDRGWLQFIKRCISRCIEHWPRVIFRQGCFAHVSILCI